MSALEMSTFWRTCSRIITSFSSSSRACLRKSSILSPLWASAALNCSGVRCLSCLTASTYLSTWSSSTLLEFLLKELLRNKGLEGGLCILVVGDIVSFHGAADRGAELLDVAGGDRLSVNARDDVGDHFALRHPGRGRPRRGGIGRHARHEPRSFLGRRSGGGRGRLGFGGRGARGLLR